MLTVVHFEVEGGGVRHLGLHGGQGALVRLQGEEDVLQVLNTFRRSAHKRLQDSEKPRVLPSVAPGRE